MRLEREETTVGDSRDIVGGMGGACKFNFTSTNTKH